MTALMYGLGGWWGFVGLVCVIVANHMSDAIVIEEKIGRVILYVAALAAFVTAAVLIATAVQR